MSRAGEATGPVAGQPSLTGTSQPASRASIGMPRRGLVEPGTSSSNPDSTTQLRRLSELRGGGSSGSFGRGGGWRPRLPHLRIRHLGWVVMLAIVAGLAWLGLRLVSAGPTITGLADGEVLTPAALAQRDIAVTVNGSAADADVDLDGRPLSGVVADGSVLRFRVPALVDGSYELTITSDRRPIGRVTTARRFVVDGTPPAIRFTPPTGPVPIDQPFTLVGSAEGATEVVVPGAQVTVDGAAVTLSFPRPPAAPVEIAATDQAGNRAVMSFSVPVPYPKTNGVHVSATAWADPRLKAGILQMIADGRVNAVELDLKDEEGVVGYDSAVPLARQIGAVQPSYQLATTLAELHGLGVRVIGRIVAFRDPVLASAAWAAGNEDWVLQTPDGQPLGDHGEFTNFVQPEVRAYNLAIAQEAAAAGIDDILWDHVRRPEGEPASMVVPGLTGRSSDEIGQFLAEGHEMLRTYGVFQGASVLGISATRPQSIAQDVPLIAQHVDYVAPMLYPERWGRTEYDVADPQAQPYDIIFRSLVDFQIAVAPMGRAVVPWLQDYSGRVRYGPAEVQAQMQAAADRGVDSWLFWSPHSEYSVDGYTPMR
ncbi:MAG TPA: putative glycoside hydrolase [Acidimicrobiales bacterium]